MRAREKLVLTGFIGHEKRLELCNEYREMKNQ